MKNITIIIAVLAMLIVSNKSFAEENTQLPKIITDALSSYEKNGANSLMPILLKGSALADDKTELSQSNKKIKQLETLYGKYLGYEPSRVVKLSDSTSIYYYVMNYELGPLFCMTVIYNTPHKGQIVTTYNFHTKPKNIYPPALLKE